MIGPLEKILPPMPKSMPRPLLLALAACAFLASTLTACVGGEPRPPFTVRLIGLNDYHGQLESPGTLGQAFNSAVRPAVGGADALAAQVARLKQGNPLNVVVGAGDLIGASPMASSLFWDEPAVEALNRIGLEFSAVGNHEFDRGTDELLRLQTGGCKRVADGSPDPSSCQGGAAGAPVPFSGARFQWLSANVVDGKTGRPLLPAYGVKSFNGVNVAFIGVGLESTPEIVAPTAVQGLEFRNEAETVNALIPELKAKGIEAIVVLLHQGGAQTGPVQDINTCDGNLAGSDLEATVRRLDDAVDLVLSAHSHAAYHCRLPNAKGRAIPVTSAGSLGRVLTSADLTLDPQTRDIASVTVSNLLVERGDTGVAPDAGVADMVNAYKRLVAPLANSVVGRIADPEGLSYRRVDVACNMPAGDLIADAQLSATRGGHGALGGAVVAFMNGGGVRSPGFDYPASLPGVPDGSVTHGQAFAVQPFGNSLVTLTLSARQIKDFLEEQFAGCLGQSATMTRIALPSVGFKYQWDGAKSCGNRISSVTLNTGGSVETLVDAAGTVLNPGKTYRVTVNDYMADGGDGNSTLKRGTQRVGGPQDIDALTAFLAGYRAPDAGYRWGAHPDDAATPLVGSTRRVNRVGAGTACPMAANTNP
jgi:5'-nucleotidase